MDKTYEQLKGTAERTQDGKCKILDFDPGSSTTYDFG